jgi:tetratricopeptide (TPR) repeat protein
MLQGNSTRALAIAQEVVRLGEDANHPDVWCSGLSLLATIQERKGEFEESIANLNKAIELAETIPIIMVRILAGSELARCYLCLGDLGKSLEILTETQNYMIKNGAKIFGHSLTILLLQAYLTAAEESVQGKKAEWLKKAKRACKEALRSTKLYRRDLALAMRLRGTYEWLIGKPSLSEEWWQQSLKVADEMGIRYELGMTHLEMGQRLKDRGHLEQAEKIFAEIGAEFDLAQARSALGRLQPRD